MDQGTLFARPAQLPFLKTDKAITLKKKTTRLQIHRYTLRFETIEEKNAEEGLQLVKDTLQRFLDIALQVEPKTIIPPYLELDRSDKAVSDISSAFPVSSIDSYHVIKKYFFRMLQRDAEGMLTENSWTLNTYDKLQG